MSGDFRARFHKAKFSTCEKELKKSLKRAVVEHDFNLRTLKAEASESLSLRLGYL